MRSIVALAFCWLARAEPTDVVRIIDADTFIVTVRVWPGIAAADERVRVLHVNTPERGKPGYMDALSFTQAWLARGPFLLSACKRDGFGRLLADVVRGNDTLSVDLIRAGFGVRFDP